MPTSSSNLDLHYGLTPSQVVQAQRQYGSNDLNLHRTSVWRVLVRQLNNPLLFILAITTVISYFYDDRINAAIIFLIMAVGVGLGFINEYSSEKTVSDLLHTISLSAIVIRAGTKKDIPVSQVTVGDVVLLQRGSVIPANLRIMEADNLLIDESSLSGEAVPVQKIVGSGEVGSLKPALAFMGTVVWGGSGKGIVSAVGKQTEFGRLSKNVTSSKEKTAFQKGLTELGTLITKVIVVMAVVIGVLNIALGKDPLEAILFSLAIAIGLTPALLPVIVTVSMARGAHQMAKRSVVVKELVGIEDLGNMDVLCTDKTGTLTEGKIQLQDFISTQGKADPYGLQVALLCNTATVHHRIIGNPIDVAIWQYAQSHHLKIASEYSKIQEVEFDFENRGQFSVVEHAHHGRLLFFKGAPEAVLERCSTYRDKTGQLVALGKAKAVFSKQCKTLNEEGLRLVAVAQRTIPSKENYGFEDAEQLELLGYLTFLDTPKISTKHALDALNSLGVAVKIVTGDNELVTKAVCQKIGFAVEGILTGPEITQMSASELQKKVAKTTIFARVSPEQKELIIKALKKAGKTVGYMGDGINDAGALHAADVSISVNTAVDVAKDVASVVLLNKSLDVIAEGVKEGRRIFTNTIKYILMGTSSNFGNMFSVAGASFFLPFLPMAPAQILLNNSLYDMSQLGLPSDNVDEEVLLHPHRWNMKVIYRYMLFFGPLSSLFDYASFAILWFGFQANVSQFQTGWFLESIATQVLVVFVIRSSRPIYASRPGNQLIGLCAVALVTAFILPFTKLGNYLHLVRLPLPYFGALALLIAIYLISVEFVKTRFLNKLAII